MNKWVKISDVLFFQEGPGVRNTQYTTEGVKLLNVANLVDGRLDLSNSDRYISEEEAYGKYSHFLCDAGDFIVASSGIKVDYIDKKMGFVEKSMLPLCMNTSTIRFKVLNPANLRIRYFMYYLKSKHFKEQLSRFITGSAQLNYGPSHLSRMIMPLIPIEDQDVLIGQMDQVQSLIEARWQQLRTLDTLIKARFVEMFDDGESPMKTVEELCSEIVDCPHTTPRYEGELKHPAIRTSEIKKGYIAWDTMRYVSDEEYEERVARLRPEKGDIVYGREGTFGNAAILPGGYSFCLGQRVMLLRPDYSKCTSEYLLHAVISDDVYRQAVEKNNASTVAHVNVKDVKQFKVPLPSFEKQKRFAYYVSQVDKSKVVVQKALDEAQLLFDSLMQKYFET